MKKLSLASMGFCVLAMLSCQKEEPGLGVIQKKESVEKSDDETVRYTDYFLESPENSSEWVTEEEYDRIMEEIGGRGKGMVTCYFPNKDGHTYTKGEACKTTKYPNCTSYDGCHAL